MSDINDLTPIKFHFFSLEFRPYNQNVDTDTSTSILRDVITYITKEKKGGKGHLIDRNRNNSKEGARELYMTSSIFMYREKRIRCSMALLRSGRIPKIKPKDKFKLIPIKDIGTIAEETHFYIDFSNDYAVVCVEYNYHGPRMSDIEFYLRHVAHETLKLSKATDVSMYMDTSIDKTLKELKNVLNIEVKVQPKKLAQLDTDIVGQYFTEMNTIGNNLKPKFLKLEALFQSPGRNVESSELNKSANTMIKTLLNRFNKKPQNIDAFENFVVKYENAEGEEEVFNLLKGKKEIIKSVNLKKIKKKREFYELIEADFDSFMDTLN